MGSSALTDATAAIDSGVKAPGCRDFSSAKVRGRGLGSSRTPKRLSWTSTASLDMPRSTLLYSENSVLPVHMGPKGSKTSTKKSKQTALGDLSGLFCYF